MAKKLSVKNERGDSLQKSCPAGNKQKVVKSGWPTIPISSIMDCPTGYRHRRKSAIYDPDDNELKENGKSMIMISKKCPRFWAWQTGTNHEGRWISENTAVRRFTESKIIKVMI